MNANRWGGLRNAGADHGLGGSDDKGEAQNTCETLSLSLACLMLFLPSPYRSLEFESGRVPHKALVRHCAKKVFPKKNSDVVQKRE